MGERRVRMWAFKLETKQPWARKERFEVRPVATRVFEGANFNEAVITVRGECAICGYRSIEKVRGLVS